MPAKKAKRETVKYTGDVKELGLSDAVLKAISGLGVMPTTDYDPVRRLPTGSMALDYALGGGLARGRVNTIFGEASWGKSTLSTLISGNTVDNGGTVAYFDQEGTFDPTWSQSLGIDPTRIHLYQGVTGEQMLDAIFVFLEHNVYDLIVIDSVGNTLFDAQYEASMQDNTVGIPARKWWQFCRKATKPLRASKTALLFVNHITLKVGVMFGSPETEPGGKAMEFAPSIKIKMLNPDRTKDGQITFRAKTSKNKTYKPHQEAEITLLMSNPPYFVDIVPELTSLGKLLGIFTREDGSPITGGGYWYFNRTRIAQGETAVQQSLYTEESLRDSVEEAVREAIANPNRVSAMGLPSITDEDTTDGTQPHTSAPETSDDD